MIQTWLDIIIGETSPYSPCIPLCVKVAAWVSLGITHATVIEMLSREKWKGIFWHILDLCCWWSRLAFVLVVVADLLLFLLWLVGVWLIGRSRVVSGWSWLFKSQLLLLLPHGDRQNINSHVDCVSCNIMYNHTWLWAKAPYVPLTVHLPIFGCS